MSASHRSLGRLPLDIFADLSMDHENPAILRGKFCAKLKIANLGQTVNVSTVGSFLQISSFALLRILDPLFSFDECNELKRRISLCCASKPSSAFSLFLATIESSEAMNGVNQMRHLPTGMSSLDQCLRGGFRVGTISEIVGRAGTGKSQLLMQLCVVAARFNQGSIYIDTENKLSLSRLFQIADTRALAKLVSANHSVDVIVDDNFVCAGLSGKKYKHESVQCRGDAKYSYKDATEVLENTTVYSPGSTSELASIINRIEEEILQRNQEALDSGTKFPVRLIVLDSIAAPVRRDFGSDSAPQRVSSLMQIAQTLKRLADQLQVAVVVVNQVGLEKDLKSSKRTNGSDYVAVRAALGTSWHHCLSTRLLIEHESDPNTTAIQDHTDTSSANGGIAVQGHVRRATVVKSNVAGLGNMFFEVVNMGVVEMQKQ